jgi:hypothetical protein
MNEYEDVLRKNGILSFTPGGNSMWPIIKNKKATVIIVPAEGRLKKYDVAFYRRENGQPVLHRVLRVNEDSYDMCGDSQLSIEKSVKNDTVFGVLKGYYKGEKFIDCNKNISYKTAVRIWSGSLWIRHIFMKILFIVGIKPN